MRTFLAFVRKDLLIFFTDRFALIFSFFVPIMLASFFGALTGGQSGKPNSGGLAIVVVDLDQSSVSRAIVHGMQTNPSLRITLTNETTALELVRNGRMAVGVILPAGFAHDAPRSLLNLSPKPEIRVPHDPSRSIEVNMVRGFLIQHVVQGFVESTSSGALMRDLAREGIARARPLREQLESDRPFLKGLFSAAEQWLAATNMAQSTANPADPAKPPTDLPLPFLTKVEPITAQPKAQFNGYAHAFAGMGVQFVLMAAIDWGIGILTERQRGLWRRLRSAPVSRRLLLGSRAVSNAIAATASLTVGFVFAILVFGVRIDGSPLGFVACILSIAALAASLGLLLASLGKTPQATRAIAIPAVLILVMLGGAWVPTFIFPLWLQKCTVLVPTRWAVDGLDAMTWRGLPFEAAITPVLVMLGFTLAFITTALWRFRWETD